MPNPKTTLQASELEDLFCLSARVFADYRSPPLGPFALAYIMSETSDNEESGFLRAVELARTGAMLAIGICDGDTTHGYDGFDHSVDRLKVYGLSNSFPIEKIVTDRVNTRTEADSLIPCMMGRKGDLAIIAPPFHIVRAFVTMVTVVRQLDVPLRVYAVPGVPLQWTAKVRHSQGDLVSTRAGLLTDELTRLEKYQAVDGGSMLPADEVLKYLDWRDE